MGCRFLTVNLYCKGTLSCSQEEETINANNGQDLT